MFNEKGVKTILIVQIRNNGKIPSLELLILYPKLFRRNETQMFVIRNDECEISYRHIILDFHIQIGMLEFDKLLSLKKKKRIFCCLVVNQCFPLSSTIRCDFRDDQKVNQSKEKR